MYHNRIPEQKGQRCTDTVPLKKCFKTAQTRRNPGMICWPDVHTVLYKVIIKCFVTCLSSHVKHLTPAVTKKTSHQGYDPILKTQPIKFTHFYKIYKSTNTTINTLNINIFQTYYTSKCYTLLTFYFHIHSSWYHGKFAVELWLGPLHCTIYHYLPSLDLSFTFVREGKR